MATTGPCLGARRRFNPFSCFTLAPSQWRRDPNHDPVMKKTALVVVLLHALALAVPLLGGLRGCVEPIRPPNGDGIATVSVAAQPFKRVKRRKYIVNPADPMYINEPVLDDQDLGIDELTTHPYVADLFVGDGTGNKPGLRGGWRDGKLRFIRLEYRGGDWDQDMGINADLNLLLEFSKRCQMPVHDHTEAVRISDLARFPKGMQPPFVYITGSQGIDVTSSEARALKEYLLRDGGMLFADNGGGHFHSSFARLLRQVLPGMDLIVIPYDDDVFQYPHKFPRGAPPLWHHAGTDALGVRYHGRWIVFYHPGDLGDAWKTGHSGASREAADAAYRMGINVMYYAMVKYAEQAGRR